MTNKPVWLLDVDGVINAVCMPHQFPDTFPKSTWRMERVNGFMIHWSTEVIDFINRMSERIEVRWHSTWSGMGGEPLDELVSTLGLNDFGTTGEDDFCLRSKVLMIDYNTDWWKMPAAVNVVTTEKRPLIWTDDDLTYAEVGHFVKAVGRDILPEEALVIRPTMNTGLSKEELDAIESFVQSWETSRGSVAI